MKKKHDQKWGFNDLERRKIFLCNFISKPCHGITEVLDIVRSIKHIPFALGAH